MIWMLRYRKPQGVTVGHFEAPTLVEAQAIGRAWCEAQPGGWRYITVEPFLLDLRNITPEAHRAAAAKTARVGT